ncbi:hypothetical protein SAMN05444342_1344 [Haladaptatus paucihalophilus DX253]|uniref:DUF7344 domain-containing protein n=2 Tax=Haladaptatus paucihalophilus DX253 TaxID=797209 RepID=A0A1M6SNT8_HALPU|nr:hypothetical protein SAMN05444342_1344 [Haladaptatus paucihalophilus DX253]
MSSNSTSVTGTNSEDDWGRPDELDTIMEVLSDHHRRYVLYHLRNSDNSAECEELAERIVEWDDRTTEHDEEDVLTELRHKHLPKMEAAGILDREGEKVRFDEPNMPIESYLDLAVELEPSESF